MDSNGDGIGDLQGIITKLDYIKVIGINRIWLSPVYKSPNDDNGYDISDDQNIMAEFSTMADFDQLLQGAHDRDIKIVIALVVNPSYDEHVWFMESRKSKDHSYCNYNSWKLRENGDPQTNWSSAFGGLAWEYDEATDEYYLHIFSKKQPDINWETETLRKVVY